MSVGLVVEIIGDASKLKSSLDDASKSSGGFMSSIGGSALKVAAFAGAAGIAVNAIADMTNAAAQDEQEQLKLEAALQAAGVATGDYNAVVDEAIAKGQDRAFSDTQTREALQSLVTATGDLTTATNLLGPAQDIARFAGVDLATAADAVAKAQAGQATQLAKLMPGLDKGANASETLANATKMAAGQADAYANSAAGMQERAGDAFSELTETIGSVFLPILKEILPVLIPIIKQFGQLITAILPILIPLLKLMYIPTFAVVKVLGFLVDVLIRLVDWFKTAIDTAAKFLDAINPLKNIKLPSLPFTSSVQGAAPAGLGVGPTAASSSGGAPLVVNVYTTGDGIEAEQAVARALRRLTRLNGGVVPAVGWTGA